MFIFRPNITSRAKRILFLGNSSFQAPQQNKHIKILYAPEITSSRRYRLLSRGIRICKDRSLYFIRISSVHLCEITKLRQIIPPIPRFSAEEASTEKVLAPYIFM